MRKLLKRLTTLGSYYSIPFLMLLCWGFIVNGSTYLKLDLEMIFVLFSVLIFNYFFIPLATFLSDLVLKQMSEYEINRRGVKFMALSIATTSAFVGVFSIIYISFELYINNNYIEFQGLSISNYLEEGAAMTFIVSFVVTFVLELIRILFTRSKILPSNGNL